MSNRLVVLAVATATACFAVGARLVYERATRVRASAQTAPEPPTVSYVRQVPAFVETLPYVNLLPTGCEAPPGLVCVQGMVSVDPLVPPEMALVFDDLLSVARRVRHPNGKSDLPAVPSDLLWREECDPDGEERIRIEPAQDDDEEDVNAQAQAALDDDDDIEFRVSPEGRFRVFLTPGLYQLRVAADSGTHLLEAHSRIDLSKWRGEDVNVKLTLRHLRWLTGMVVNDRYGLPLAYGNVLVEMESPLIEPRCVPVGDDGGFGIMVPADLGGTLVFKHPGYRPKLLRFEPNQDELRVGLERSAVLVGRLSERLRALCGEATVLLEAPLHVQGQVDPREDTVLDDCTFQMEGLTVPGPRRLSVVSESGSLVEAFVNVPARGDPDPVCLGGPCDRAAALLVVQLALGGLENRMLRSLDVEGNTMGFWASASDGYQAIVTPATFDQEVVIVTVAEEQMSNDRILQTEPATLRFSFSREVRLHPGVNELVVGR